MSSSLTSVECARVLAWGVAARRLGDADELGPLTVVSLDHRVRDNARALGFDTVP